MTAWYRERRAFEAGKSGMKSKLWHPWESFVTIWVFHSLTVKEGKGCWEKHSKYRTEVTSRPSSTECALNKCPYCGKSNKEKWKSALYNLHEKWHNRLSAEICALPFVISSCFFCSEMLKSGVGVIHLSYLKVRVLPMSMLSIQG